MSQKERRNIDGPWGVLQVELERLSSEVLELSEGPGPKGETRKAAAARESAHHAATNALLYLAKGEVLLGLDHLAVGKAWVGVGMLDDRAWAEQVDRAEKGESMSPLRHALRTAWEELAEVPEPCGVHILPDQPVDVECISCAVERAVRRAAARHLRLLTAAPRREWADSVRRARVAAAALGDQR